MDVVMPEELAKVIDAAIGIRHRNLQGRSNLSGKRKEEEEEKEEKKEEEEEEEEEEKEEEEDAAGDGHL
ncbi:hypothetical protein Bca4012_095579 [Brassica carinata]